MRFSLAAFCLLTTLLGSATSQQIVITRLNVNTYAGVYISVNLGQVQPDGTVTPLTSCTRQTAAGIYPFLDSIVQCQDPRFTHHLFHFEFVPAGQWAMNIGYRADPTKQYYPNVAQGQLLGQVISWMLPLNPVSGTSGRVLDLVGAPQPLHVPAGLEVAVVPLPLPPLPA